LYVVQEEQWQSPIYHHRSEFAGSPKSKHDLFLNKKKTKRVQLFSQRGRRIIVNLNSVMFFFLIALNNIYIGIKGKIIFSWGFK